MYGAIQIGRYSQIGAQVAIIADDHPISYLSTYVNHRLFQGELSRYKNKGTVDIGNDVWIGHGAIILKDVIIGDGAIIGAGSVVTHNVPAFAIVAGNPATVIKYRFSEQVQNEILQLAWWNQSPVELLNLKPLFHVNFANNTSIYDKHST